MSLVSTSSKVGHHYILLMKPVIFWKNIPQRWISNRRGHQTIADIFSWGVLEDIVHTMIPWNTNEKAHKQDHNGRKDL